MTVEELIGELEQYDGEAEVRLAFQPSWPLQYHIREVAEVALGENESEDTECSECNGEGCETCGGSGQSAPEGETHKVVYIAEGGQVYDAPYLPAAASQTLGWK